MERESLYAKGEVGFETLYLFTTGRVWGLEHTHEHANFVIFSNWRNCATPLESVVVVVGGGGGGGVPLLT